MINSINDSIDTLIEVQQCQTFQLASIQSAVMVTNSTTAYMFHQNLTHVECDAGIQSNLCTLYSLSNKAQNASDKDLTLEM